MFETEKLFSWRDDCNVVVEPVAKAAIELLVPPYVFRTQERFHRCPSCDASTGRPRTVRVCVRSSGGCDERRSSSVRASCTDETR